MGDSPRDQVKVVFARRALREIERHARWWSAHRDAVGVFEAELAEALRDIRENPNLGRVYRLTATGLQRRVLMPKLDLHVYYRVGDADHVYILSVWGARRGYGPKP